MDYEKDKTGNFERGCPQSNHRKVTGSGLSQDAKRPIMTLGSRVMMGGSAKSPGREFLMDYEKDKTGNFERGYS